MSRTHGIGQTAGACRGDLAFVLMAHVQPLNHTVAIVTARRNLTSREGNGLSRFLHVWLFVSFYILRSRDNSRCVDCVGSIESFLDWVESPRPRHGILNGSISRIISLSGNDTRRLVGLRHVLRPVLALAGSPFRKRACVHAWSAECLWTGQPDSTGSPPYRRCSPASVSRYGERLAPQSLSAQLAVSLHVPCDQRSFDQAVRQ